MHQQQTQSREIQRGRAQSLAGLLVTFRSAAHFYPTRESRRAWIERVFLDVRYDEFVRTFAGNPEVLPSARTALVEFCLGHIGVRVLGERLCDCFRNTATTTTNGVQQQLQSVAAADDEPTSSTGETSQIEYPRFGLTRLNTFWFALHQRLRSLTVTPGTTNDGYDARIEFAREFIMDLRSGMPPLIQQSVQSRGSEFDRLVSDVDCLTTLATIGHLNKSMVNNNAMMMDIDASQPVGAAATTYYPVYVFGSNCIWIRSDALYTLRFDTDGVTGQPPAALEGDEEVTTFVEHILTYSGGAFEADQDACVAAAVQGNVPMVTSLSRNSISLQLAFAMPDSRLYTANVFYLKGGSTCSTDIKYKREYLSNACQCENRMSHWRLVVSVAAFDGSRLESVMDGRMVDFVNCVIRAFQRTKYDQGAHFFVNQFTGLALVNYRNDSTALGGMNAVANMADDSSPARVCNTHLWLRAHANSEYWRSMPPRLTNLLLQVPQLLVVYRPLVSECATEANGPSVFVDYKTFDDVVLKYVLLSSDTLRNGYEDRPKGVAYKSADNYWLFSDKRSPVSSPSSDDNDENGSTPADQEVDPPWIRNADHFVSLAAGGSHRIRTGRKRFKEFYNPVADLFRRVFSAPSRLYVHSNVISKLGFNVTLSSFSGGEEMQENGTVRTFTHTDPDTQERCTVFCSSPTVIINEKTGLPLERGADDDYEMEIVENMLHVLKHDGSRNDLDDVLRKYRDVSVAAESLEQDVVSLQDFWPGVKAVKISFNDPVLEDVQFVFFVAADGGNSTRRLTKKGLSRLCRFNMRSTRQILPPPVLYTLQQIFVRLVR